MTAVLFHSDTIHFSVLCAAYTSFDHIFRVLQVLIKNGLNWTIANTVSLQRNIPLLSRNTHQRKAGYLKSYLDFSDVIGADEKYFGNKPFATERAEY